MNPPEILGKFAEMQKKYFAAHNKYSTDLSELLALYGRGRFLNAEAVSSMIGKNDLKMTITSTGFEISMRIGGAWQTITESGELQVRPQ